MENVVRTIWGWLVLIGIAAYIYWWGIDVVWYSAEYGVSTDKVHIDPKPTDCDFWHAPVGFKGCHYEREVVGWERPAASGMGRT